jgi:hypothetical protein
MESGLRAGIARTDITPPIGIAHAGWGAQTHQRAAGVDLPLWATALALSDGEETVVLVDLDIGYLWEPEANEALQAVAGLTGLPVSHIRLAYSHTHSGPVNGAGWGEWFTEGVDMVSAYDQTLPHKIAGVAWAALNNLQPARLAAGKGTCNIGVNRRFRRPEDGATIVGLNWDGVVDPELKVIRIDSLAGEPLAAIVNYACHPTTVGPDNDLLTPDYPGVTRRVVESATGATCLFLQGAAGNIGPIRGTARGGLGEYRRLGSILGHAASRLWWELETRPRRDVYVGTLESGAPLALYDVAYHEEPNRRLRVGVQKMRLPLKEMPAPEPLEAQAREHAARLVVLRSAGGSPDEIRNETMQAKRTTMRAGLARQLHGQTHRLLQAQAFTIGDDIALMAVPGEPFAEIGLAVKRDSPFEHTLFSGYSNAGWAYIPTPDAYPLGGYEVEITPFSPEAAGLIVANCLDLMRRLAD